jgi:hypothetical protein
MTLTDANRCQICGDALFHDDVYSDPSQHFCISVDGPAMTNNNNNSNVDSIHEVRTTQVCESKSTPTDIFGQSDKEVIPEVTKTTARRKISLRVADSERPTKVRRVTPETSCQVAIEGM